MENPVTRREFAGLAAAGAFATGCTDLTQTVMAGQKGIPKQDATDKSTDEQKSDRVPVQSDLVAVPAVDLFTAIVRKHFPHPNLKGEMLEEVRSDIQQYLTRSKLLSDFPLKNSDEPGFVFAAWRRDPL